MIPADPIKGHYLGAETTINTTEIPTSSSSSEVVDVQHSLPSIVSTASCPATEFHVFKELPIELRFKIWEETVSSRSVNLENRPEGTDALWACRESRDLLRPRYTHVSQTPYRVKEYDSHYLGSIEYFWVQGIPCNHLVNFEIDAICLNRPVRVRRSIAFSEVRHAIEQYPKVFLTLTKKLHITIDATQLGSVGHASWLEAMWHSISNLKALEEVDIVFTKWFTSEIHIDSLVKLPVSRGFTGYSRFKRKTKHELERAIQQRLLEMDESQALLKFDRAEAMRMRERERLERSRIRIMRLQRLKVNFMMPKEMVPKFLEEAS